MPVLLLGAPKKFVVVGLGKCQSGLAVMSINGPHLSACSVQYSFPKGRDDIQSSEFEDGYSRKLAACSWRVDRTTSEG